MKILVILLSLGCTGASFADEGATPTWNPEVNRGAMDPSPGAGTFIPPGSSPLGNSQARDGVDSIGGFDGTRSTPGALGGDTDFPAGPSELQVPGRNAMPSNGGHF
jgi:hypothetical protein